MQTNEHPQSFPEKPPPPDVPSTRVILCRFNNPHITRLQSIRLSLGDVFYLNACIALNLFSNETEAKYCFIEVIETLRTPHQMRLLLIHLLTNDCINAPVEIWVKFQQPLSEDFHISNGGNWSLALSSALLKIARHLKEYSKEPQDYSLPQPDFFGNEVVAEIQRWSPHICQECSKNSALFAQFLLTSLTYVLLSYFIRLHCTNFHAPLPFCFLSL